MTESSEIPVEVVHLFISAGHNYVGHFGKAPGEHPMEAREEVQCEAGRGLIGDRYHEREAHHTKQISFFDMAVYDRMVNEFHLTDKTPAAMRRNVLLRGIDLNRLIGRRFSLQGLTFEGLEECKPCFWMDQALHPGAEELLKGSGGLRARILTSGALRTGTYSLSLEQPGE